ncbi:hypothetical protein [Mesorhizobium sp. AA22]|uniref:hypothetical protein n=1 Tax=Mesorhizobium sp. AA22 TaxID=1854057 RepID=UPI0012E9DA70|nr:hypothetical protein [Mesorhizobium sp. AA22]QIA22732.1 hypothetical protein A9K68_013890 [Mesorhizobium sp. AA22]
MQGVESGHRLCQLLTPNREAFIGGDRSRVKTVQDLPYLAIDHAAAQRVHVQMPIAGKPTFGRKPSKRANDRFFRVFLRTPHATISSALTFCVCCAAFFSYPRRRALRIRLREELA